MPTPQLFWSGVVALGSWSYYLDSKSRMIDLKTRVMDGYYRNRARQVPVLYRWSWRPFLDLYDMRYLMNKHEIKAVHHVVNDLGLHIQPLHLADAAYSYLGPREMGVLFDGLQEKYQREMCQLCTTGSWIMALPRQEKHEVLVTKCQKFESRRP